ncbi:OmpA family protein [uncultured Thiodictyon sp.]|jgi:outer membrane protein OmpA-like peptidoglycan-associated protein|uniref:OmpA family protein n=1 Tax=uncultured Thiodictyon sp. TaxID=1846217 RepID=UPI0025E4CC33|nr:OmpA family protein [uncultured Thiodictyon sp.]
MARYFRCEEPGGHCRHARTRAVLVDEPGVCPLNHPDCAQWRRPVRVLTALRERSPVAFWGVAGVVGVVAFALLLLMLLLLFGGNHWRDGLDRLQTQLTGLNDQLKGLELQTSKPVDPGRAWEELQHAGQSLRNDVRKAVTTAATAEVAGLQARLEDLEQQQQALLGSARPNPKGAQAQAMAKRLVGDYQTLKTGVLTAQAAAPPEDDEARQAFRILLVDVDKGLKRAQRLAGPAPPPPAPPSTLVDTLTGALVDARDGVDTLSASVTIATSPVLASALVLPLLEARAPGSTIRSASDAQHWFVASHDPVIAPGVLVSVADPDPYRPLLAGRADLVIADQTPDNQAQAEFSARFPGQAMTARDHAAVIALDAVALLGHPARANAPVTNLGLSNWGTDAASAPMIARLVPSLALSVVADPFTTVQSDPGALSAVLHHQWQRHPVGQLVAYQPSRDAPALKPNDFSIGTENYPLCYRVLATRSPGSRPAAKDLMTWITSDAGQSAVKAAGFVDLRLLPKPGGSAADPLILSALGRAVGQNVTSAEQSPTNLRFALNEAELDLKALADLERLNGPLKARITQGHKVVILGFTDAIGSEQQNFLLSVERARQVAERLATLGVQAVTTGLGEELPVDTNDTDAGRARNRRAEVWVVSPDNSGAAQ